MTSNPFDISNVPPPEPVEIAGTDNPHIAWRLVRDLSHSVSGLGEGETMRTDRVTASVEMVKNLEPQDALEAHMIAQMMASHNVISAAMHRANSPGTSEESQLTWLRQAMRFITQFRAHSQALTKYRGTPKEMEADARERALEAKLNAWHKAEAARQREAKVAAEKNSAGHAG